jgi:hypothetical protein
MAKCSVNTTLVPFVVPSFLSFALEVLLLYATWPTARFVRLSSNARLYVANRNTHQCFVVYHAQ